MSATPEQIAAELEDLAGMLEAGRLQLWQDDVRAAAALIRAQAERVRVLEGALGELTGWIDRALVPSYTARKPMPENLEAALAKAHAALKGEA